MTRDTIPVPSYLLPTQEVDYVHYIDPSYTGTAFCTVSKDRHVRYSLFSQGQTKRSLQGYLDAAFKLRDAVQAYVESLPGSHIIVMEAPFPGGLSSPGLYLLQGLFQDFFLHCPAIKEVWSLPPNWISQSVKKAREDKKDSTSVRKELIRKAMDDLSAEGWMFDNPEAVKLAGADIATAGLFWVFTQVQKRVWQKLVARL